VSAVAERVRKQSPGKAFFDSAYRGFATDVRTQVRRDTYETDMGQTSWLDIPEWRRFAEWLKVGPESTVLDVACGSGGPALQLARDTGAAVVGIDVHADAITAAYAAGTGERRAHFERADAAAPLDFRDASFEAITCIDAIHHFPDRAAVLADWRRVLKPGGIVLYTDPVVVTGIVSRDELDTRAAVGHFSFSYPGENERLLAAAGLERIRTEDTTESVARIAARWEQARARHKYALEFEEGYEVFHGTQRFLRMTAKLAREARLSRHVLVARRAA
jgi:ubiquinone/menaquinone biosynthesis C-methylase UbiE